ncbi:hypothetical protein WR25_11541 [Diploscapter pachys]|uniref:Peroxin/Ferlin domain-containing protein n=1 Tax=Diploscapter pachys TaxID=2018661 RepID=A0A2A2JSH9_9BILA|nr:hypothetical protein WR25_11541 [Diploscapter pachys]
MAEEQGYLWLVSKDGTAFRVRCFDQLDSYSDLNWQRIDAAEPLRCISALPHAAYSVDQKGSCWILVTPNHIARRTRRWFPLLGWTKTLPTERKRYSDENGCGSHPPASFGLKSLGWRWQEPWTVDLDSRRFDKEGWEYSGNFNLTRWSNECGRGHFVRRKKLVRTQRYVALDTWVEMSSNGSASFLDIACGAESDKYFVYALGDDGKIYNRTNVSQENPEGDEWTVVSMTGIIENEHITSICCSPSSGVLLALTWNGQIYAKSSRFDEWLSVPSPQNLPATNAAIGASSLWVITSDSRLFVAELHPPFRHSDPSDLIHQFSLADPDSYIEVGSKVSRPSINSYDQLIGLSLADGALYARMGISRSERAGKTFERIIESLSRPYLSSLQISFSGCTLKEVPKHWIVDKICIFDEEFRSAEWRKQILNLLAEMNEKNWSSLKDLQMSSNAGGDDGGEIAMDHHSEGITSSPVQIDLSGNDKFRRGKVTITKDVIRFHLDSGVQEQLPAANLLSVTSTFQYSPHRISLALSSASHKLNKTVITFTEEMEAEKFQLQLEKLIRTSLISASRSHFHSCMWSVGEDGHVRQHFLSELESSANGEIRPVALDRIRSLTVPGFMQSIAAGCDRIVWATSLDGCMWALDPLYDSLSIDDYDSGRVQTVGRTFHLDEYQKSAFLRGFVTFEGKSKGIAAWMIDGQVVPPKCPRLPNRHWSWTYEEWSIDYSNNADVDGWTYATDITANYEVADKEEIYNKYARKRRWFRNAEYRAATPWIKVNGPRITQIDVQKKSNERIFIIALTVHGNVLLRQGVTGKDPVGNVWKEIISNFPLSSIRIVSPFCISAMAEDGQLIVRQCTDQTDMEYWERAYFDKATLVDPLPITTGIPVIYLNQDGRVIRINPKIDHCTISPLPSDFSPKNFISDSNYRLYALCDGEIVRFLKSRDTPIATSSFRKKSKKTGLEDMYEVERCPIQHIQSISIV